MAEKQKAVTTRIKTQINDRDKVKNRVVTLPEINYSRKNSSLSLSKKNRKSREKQMSLQKEKVILTKWIGDHRMLINQNLGTEL